MASSTALQKGDLVFITGGTGWVGSHIVGKALEFGLNVRLAYRDEAKIKPLVEAQQKRFPDATIETVLVRSFDDEGAYDEALKDGKVKGVVHAASVMDKAHWDDVIPPVIKSYETILEASARQPSVKRFVLTSSSTALGVPNLNPDATQHFTRETWNEGSVQRARADPAGRDVYAASKTLSEQRAWQFVREQKPHFVLNSVLPNACFGKPVDGVPYASTGKWFRNVLLNGDGGLIERIDPQYQVDVDDIGTLHILGLVQEDVQGERILGFGERFTWDTIIDLGKKYVPDAKAPAKSERSAAQDNTTVDVSRTAELLKPYGGIKPLEYSFKRNFDL